MYSGQPESDRQSFQNKLKRELEESEWLQKYRQMGQSLLALKAEVPLTELCDLKWDTETDSLLIRCPNAEVWESLQHHQAKFRSLQIAAARVILQFGDREDINILTTDSTS
ncbi:MAG: hypothetical protein AAGE92_01825 [Cyanobacteria bacterium P01_G01_bin.4]